MSTRSPSARAPPPRFAPKLRVNHVGVIHSRLGSMTWRDRMKAVLDRRGTIAGAAFAAVAIGADPRSPSPAAAAPRRKSSLTVNLPPAVERQDLRRSAGARTADRGDRRGPRRPRSGREERFGRSGRKGFDSRARPRASRRSRQARPGPRRHDPRRRPLSDARRSRRRRAAAERGDVRLAAHGQRAQSARPRAPASIRCPMSLRTPTRRASRRSKMPASTSANSGGSVEAILSDLAMRAQMSASADLAARLVNKSAGRFELRPEPAPLRRFPRPSPRRSARGAVRGRLHQQCRRRAVAALARASLADRARARSGGRSRRRRPFAALTR